MSSKQEGTKGIQQEAAQKIRKALRAFLSIEFSTEDENYDAVSRAVDLANEALAALRDVKAGTMLYKASMPEAFGYGLEAFDTSISGALAGLRKEYAKWKRGNSGLPDQMRTFDRAMEYFGGTVQALKAGSHNAEGEAGEVIAYSEALALARREVEA